MGRDRGFRHWLPGYVLHAPGRMLARMRSRPAPVHVMFLVCDHYEPRHAMQTETQPGERVAAWESGYADFFQRCVGEFGHGPRHSWFYPPHHGLEHLAPLSRMAFAGLGEVELHYHHDDDTSETLRRDLQDCLRDYNRRGLLLASGEKPACRFGFIHGDWALDNACNGENCGVNDELTILQELGCWGDFTMPSANECQTRKINSIYYAVDDPERPKSHDSGTDARVGVSDPEGLFLMQGPLGLNFSAPRYPRVENACLSSNNWGRADRIRFWMNSNIHVSGRPEWLFIKLHTHGAIEKDFDALFGERAWRMHRMLNETCNDGVNYRLHYVTAREAYNICKAAEAGCAGDPDEYRDFLVPPPVTAFYSLEEEHDVLCCTGDRLEINNIDATQATGLALRYPHVKRVSGAFTAVRLRHAERRLELDAVKPGERLTVTLAGATGALNISGGTVEGDVHTGLERQVTVKADGGQPVVVQDAWT